MMSMIEAVLIWLVLYYRYDCKQLPSNIPLNTPVKIYSWNFRFNIKFKYVRAWVAHNVCAFVYAMNNLRRFRPQAEQRTRKHIYFLLKSANFVCNRNIYKEQTSIIFKIFSFIILLVKFWFYNKVEICSQNVSAKHLYIQ